MDSRAFRNACGQFATGVTIVTTTGPAGEPLGLTVNSFSSVSLDPPMVLFCIGRDSSCFAAFQEAECYVVNILGADQRDLASDFAKSGNMWSQLAYYTTWDTGAPVLDGCLANLDCRIAGRHDAGDHVILVGAVQRIGVVAGKDAPPPLLYFGGGFRALSPA